MLLALVVGALASATSLPKPGLGRSVSAEPVRFDEALSEAFDGDEEDFSEGDTQPALGLPASPGHSTRPSASAAPSVHSTRPSTSAARSPSGSGSSMQWLTTSRMKEQLRQLGYSDDESSRLSPPRAAAIIDRSIPRPPGGVPAAWCGDGGRSARKGPLSATRFRKRVVEPLLRVCGFAGVGLLLYLSSGGQLPREYQRQLERVGEWLQTMAQKPTRYQPPFL